MTPTTLRRIAALEKTAVPAYGRVSESEQARVLSELRQMLPCADIAALLRDILDPARIGGVSDEALRIVASCRIE